MKKSFPKVMLWRLISFSSFAVEDENYNYITARFPGDVELLSEKLVTLVNSV